MASRTVPAAAASSEFAAEPHSSHSLTLLCSCASRLLSPHSGPTTVLVLSLLFIAFVVLLHIWGKFRKG